ncbi:endonuclease domain-containing protein [Lacisediminihabitans changchengi]|uniref:DUF559 domain-containing protein n=1 Tax=Lacisediminihabitans changchengi TaxID=2787634 RepID=A0A934W5B4_9MICO|nr:DUF559 domain-containing protein [Lacisediminihabitans changchengi]MBK4348315.1 DUF559 domain-containing protein [Lacisediminihabitans changchengi]
MQSIHHDIYRRGGVAATWELLTDGHSSHELTRAVRSGEIIRARQGHYVSPLLSIDEIRAVRVGGRLTGLIGARTHGIWTPRNPPFTVRTQVHARALRVPDDHNERLPGGSGLARWRSATQSGTRTVLSVADCLDDVIRVCPARLAFACVESALHLGLLRRAELDAMIRRSPRRVRSVMAGATRASESGSESLLSFDLRKEGIPFRQQVSIDSVGRVDFLVGAHLVIEVDSLAHHSSVEAYERDRDRDAQLSCLGYRVLRFSYRQITSRPAFVLDAIVAAIARGDTE